MAIVYRNQGDYGKALEFCDTLLFFRRETLGESHPPNVPDSYNNMGSVYYSRKETSGSNALEYLNL